MLRHFLPDDILSVSFGTKTDKNMKYIIISDKKQAADCLVQTSRTRLDRLCSDNRPHEKCLPIYETSI